MLTTLIKTAVEYGLKSAAPIVGTLGSELATAAASELIDRSTKAKSEDIQRRLFDRIERDLSRALRPTVADGRIPTPVIATVKSMLGNYQIDLQQWATSGFDPAQASKRALDQGQSLLVGLNPNEHALCKALIEAFFRALADERSAVESTELQFRQQVLNGLSRLPSVFAQVSEDMNRQLQNLVATAVVRIPIRAWNKDLSPPGALLRADIDDPVPFHGREDEAASFLAWCDCQMLVGVRVVTGPGGIGKTRTMVEMCSRLRRQRWYAGFLDSRLSGGVPGCWTSLLNTREPLLVVVDYAETRRDQVIELIRQLLVARRKEKTRVVLLARAADDWWDDLRRQPHGVGDLLSGPASQNIRLLPLTIDDEDRRMSFSMAAKHFAKKLNATTARDLPEDLADSCYEQTLFLHMTALAAVEGVVVKGHRGILDYVLQRERRFWVDHADRRGLPRYLEAAIGQFMAAITLVGGVEDKPTACELAAGVPLLTDQSAAIQHSVVELLHDIYPGDRWIEPLLPDLLGEHLCQVELDGEADKLLEVILGPPERSRE